VTSGQAESYRFVRRLHGRYPETGVRVVVADKKSLRGTCRPGREPNLVMDFAAVTSLKDLLKFYRRYGPLAYNRQYPSNSDNPVIFPAFKAGTPVLRHAARSCGELLSR
jgi:hypothetical protein